MNWFSANSYCGDAAWIVYHGGYYLWVSKTAIICHRMYARNTGTFLVSLRGLFSLSLDIPLTLYLITVVHNIIAWLSLDLI